MRLVCVWPHLQYKHVRSCNAQGQQHVEQLFDQADVHDAHIGAVMLKQRDEPGMHQTWANVAHRS